MPTENDEENLDLETEDAQTYIVELTRAEALRRGVIHCECGHPPNNHFDHGERSCAHCGCEKLRERVSIGRDASGELAASQAECEKLKSERDYEREARQSETNRANELRTECEEIKEALVRVLLNPMSIGANRDARTLLDLPPIEGGE